MTPYADIDYADDYFDTRLHSDLWANQSVSDRTKALTTATQRIDRLRFSGAKTDSAQELEFPRGGDTDVPNDILIACCEIAFALLDGRDPEVDINDLQVSSQGFHGVRNAFEREFQLDHIACGIPSAFAWSYLRPYLRDVSEVKVSRV